MATNISAISRRCKAPPWHPWHPWHRWAQGDPAPWHLGRTRWAPWKVVMTWESHGKTMRTPWTNMKNAGFMIFYVVFNEILFAGTLRRWDVHGILRYFKKEQHGGEWDITYCNMGISWEITNERERGRESGSIVRCPFSSMIYYRDRKFTEGSPD